MTIVLFDIDGTLVRTGGAGSRAMNRAFDDVFGIAGAFDGIPMAGRTDKWILDAAAARAGIEFSPSTLARFRAHYVRRLLDALSEPGHPQDVLPGVQRLLEALAPRTDVFLALLTGNSEDGARLKLAHFDLWRFFRCGAYGGDADERNALFDVAMQRARDCGAPDVPPQRVMVVGDTELDVAVALAAGAQSVAVATGSSNVAVLRECGADIVFDDLSDTAAFLRLL